MTSGHTATRFDYFAVTAPGLEPLLQRELAALGFDARVVVGGVEGKLTQSELWDLHLKSALADSVRIRLKSFKAQDFFALEKGLERLPWHAYLRRGQAAEVKVTCHKSRLFHSDAVSERTHAVIERVLGPRKGSQDARQEGQALQERDVTDFVQQIYVRLTHDLVTTSIDASGDLLHRRGYRTHVEKAPLRETLAAAMVRFLTELDESHDRVCDPFCGSGVLPLEWLRARRGVLPGAQRGFAFESWPIHSQAAWQAQRRERVLESAHQLNGSVRAQGSDVDPKAIQSCRANALAADQAQAIELEVADFRLALARQPAGTAILTNPPYGVRIGDAGRARRLYLELDEVLAQRRDLRPVVITCVDSAFTRRAKLPWRTLVKTRQGGLDLALLGLPPE